MCPSPNKRFIQVSLIMQLLIGIPNGLFAYQLDVYEGAHSSGNKTEVNVTQCVNLPRVIAGKVSSINSHNMCAKLYSGWNCTGDSVEILAHSPSHGDLDAWDFDDKAKSVEPCLDSCDISITGSLPPSPFEVRGFKQANFGGSYIDISVNGCTQVPEAYRYTVSIDTNGECVQLWMNANCTSRYKIGEYDHDTVELRTYTPKHNDLPYYWGFGKIVAISHCAWKCNGSRSDIRNDTKQRTAETVKDNELLIYNQANYVGTRHTIHLSKGCINLGKDSEGKAMSVKTGPNVCLTLYELRGCGGRSMELTGSKKNLRNERFERVVRSLRYCETKPWYLSVSEVSVIVGALLGLLGISIGVSYHVMRRMKRAISLSEREIREFLEGVTASLETDKRSEVGSAGPQDLDTVKEVNNDLQTAALNVAYNKSYEISRIQFALEITLGSGQFGIVYRGILQTDKDPKKIVAVKTLKSSSTVTELRCLMKEVKVMLYIKELGIHSNVVEVIGCCTEQLKTSGNLYMLMEYYSKGSLENHLHNIKANSGKLETQQALKWMDEIASGMEFLSKSKIVHRDLSTRNILLDEAYHAKIGDFGLSRQLYENTTYLRKGTEPLAWQWLPIEALLHSTFTTKSDVWSYGVVCWEIFTLAEEPFSGDHWGKDFIDKISLGYRLPAPRDCSDKCYQLMLKCWLADPLSRPDFSHIIDELRGMNYPQQEERETLPKLAEGYVDSFVIYV